MAFRKKVPPKSGGLFPDKHEKSNEKKELIRKEKQMEMQLKYPAIIRSIDEEKVSYDPKWFKLTIHVDRMQSNGEFAPTKSYERYFTENGKNSLLKKYDPMAPEHAFLIQIFKMAEFNPPPMPANQTPKRRKRNVNA